MLRWTFFLEGNFIQGRRDAKVGIFLGGNLIHGRRGVKVGIFPRREFCSRNEIQGRLGAKVR